MKSKLQQLREAIIKEIPEIVELKFGCEVIDTEYGRNNIHKFISSNKDFTYILRKDKEFQEWTHRFKEFYKVIGRKITLADVLRVIGGSYYVRGDGYFYEIVCDINDGESQKIEMTKYDWNLSKNDLNLQSKPTIDFLSKIILKGNEK